MDYGAEILKLFGQGSPQADQPFNVALNYPQSTAYASPKITAASVQEKLGAKEPDDGGDIGAILSGRFKAPDTGGVGAMLSGGYTQDDATNALAKTLYSGTYSSPDEIAAVRGGSIAKQLYAMANVQKLASGQNLPAAVQIANEIARRRAAGDTQGVNDLTLSAKLLDKGIVPDANGGAAVIPGYAGAVGDISKGKETGKETGKLDVERQAGFTKAQSAMRGFEQQASLVTGTIDKALATINKPWSAATGYARGASFGGATPNSDARQLDNYLTTIKANLGFDKLQNMRENSPTGGALGQISDFENKLLQAVNGALDPLQGEQLKDNLALIKELYPQVLAERRRAFEQDYGNVQSFGGNTQAPPAPITNQQPASLDGWSIEPAD